MIDIRRLFSAMTQVLRSADYPNAAALSGALDLDLSNARIGRPKSAMVVKDGGLNGAGLALTGIVCGVIPRKEIWLFFENSGLPYREIKDKIFGADQRLIPSKLSQGVGVRFEIDGLTCGYRPLRPTARSTVSPAKSRAMTAR